jgi:hypothetical protein
VNRPLMNEAGERLMALRKRLIERNVQTEEATALACALLLHEGLAELAGELVVLVSVLDENEPPEGGRGRIRNVAKTPG